MTEHRLTKEDAGRAIQIAAGDRLVLALEETPGSGYTWTPAELPADAKVVDERFEQPPGAGIGGATRHVFVIEAPSGGRLRLLHARPWERSSDQAEEFELTAVATPAR